MNVTNIKIYENGIKKEKIYEMKLLSLVLKLNFSCSKKINFS